MPNLSEKGMCANFDVENQKSMCQWAPRKRYSFFGPLFNEKSAQSMYFLAWFSFPILESDISRLKHERILQAFS